MCGIFGLIRNDNALHPERATAVLIELGKHSVERGRDSAGLAFIPNEPCTPKNILLEKPNNKPTQTTQTGIHIHRSIGTFDEFWKPREHTPLAAQARAIIGHTRAATQGSRTQLINASPMTQGTLIGTHNGDVDKESVNTKSAYTEYGGTDTEKLYKAISERRAHRGRIRGVLENAEGRIALAWHDETRPGKMFLARAGLSPLSVAYDAEGNFYYASSPQWFRDIDEKFNGLIGFTEINLVAEGTLLTIDYRNADVTIEDIRRFQPRVRESDTRLSEGIVWRGFTKSDRETDQSQSTHIVVPNRPEPQPKRRVGSRFASKYSSMSDTNTTSGAWWGGDEDYVIARSETDGWDTPPEDYGYLTEHGFGDDEVFPFDDSQEDYVDTFSELLAHVHDDEVMTESAAQFGLADADSMRKLLATVAKDSN